MSKMNTYIHLKHILLTGVMGGAFFWPCSPSSGVEVESKTLAIIFTGNFCPTDRLTSFHLMTYVNFFSYGIFALQRTLPPVVGI